MSKSNDLIKAKNLVPQPQQQYRSANGKSQKIDRFLSTKLDLVDSNCSFRCITKANIYR